MSHIDKGFLVIGPWPKPLTPTQQDVADRFRLEAAEQGLSTLEITRDGMFEFRVSLTPDTDPAPIARPMGVPTA